MQIKIVQKLKIFHWFTLLLGLPLAYASNDRKKSLSVDEKLAFQYVKNRKLDELKILIKQKEINLDMIDSDGNTLLHLAIQGFDDAMIQYLLSFANIDPNIRNNNQKAPLHLAIDKWDQKEAEKIAKWLLDHQNIDPNLEPNVEIDDEDTPLETVTEKGYTKIMKWLLNHKKIAPNLEGALSIAFSRKNKEAIQILLADDRLNPNIKTTWTTPGTKGTRLHFLVEQNDEEMVKLLLASKKLKPNLVNEKQYTPLQIAAEKGDKQMVILLLGDKRVDPNFHNEEVDPPLHIARNRFKIEVVEELLNSERLNPNLEDNSGMTLLHYAMEDNTIEILKLLLANPKLNPNIPNKKGQTPLDYAFYRGLLYQNRIDLLLGDERNDPRKITLDIDRWIQVAKEANNEEMTNLLKKYREHYIVKSTTSEDSQNGHQGLATNTISNSPQNRKGKNGWDQIVFAAFLTFALVALIGCYAVIYHFKNRKKEITNKREEKYNQTD